MSEQQTTSRLRGSDMIAEWPDDPRGVAQAVIDKYGPERIPYVSLAATVNMAGGQPVSMANVRALRELCERYGVPVYLDLDQNGALDPGEPTTTTNSSGQYSFTNLLPGTYQVRELRPDSTNQTSPAGNNSPRNVTVPVAPAVR